MWRMFCIGKLTCKSFMPKMMILLYLLAWILFISCVISCEFMVVFWSSLTKTKQMKRQLWTIQITYSDLFLLHSYVLCEVCRLKRANNPSTNVQCTNTCQTTSIRTRGFGARLALQRAPLPAHSDTRREFFGTRQSLLSQLLLISFAWPSSLYCEVYMYIYTYMTACKLYMNQRCYQTTRQWNIFTQIGAVRSVDWIFIVGAPVWPWLGEYVTLDRTFYSLLLKQELAAAPIFFLITFLRRPLLDIKYII